MIVAVDIGNSRIKAGVKVEDAIEYRTTETRPFQEAGSYIEKLGIEGEIEGVVLSSVVDELEDTFKEVAVGLCGREPLVVSNLLDTGLTYAIKHPETVGADRIANGVAAYTIAGGPVIAVDIGTAITFTVVGKGAELLGGCIMPGAALMAEALGKRTSRLPVVDFFLPPHVIGKDTEENIKSGLGYGIAGAVERIVAEIRNEIGYTMKTVLTGGMCGIFDGLIRDIDAVDPLLTLKGLFTIYEKNKR